PPSAAAARSAWITGSRFLAANSLISFRWALVAGSGTTINPKFGSRPHWAIAASISFEPRSGAPTTSTANFGAAATAAPGHPPAGAYVLGPRRREPREAQIDQQLDAKAVRQH